MLKKIKSVFENNFDGAASTLSLVVVVAFVGFYYFAPQSFGWFVGGNPSLLASIIFGFPILTKRMEQTQNLIDVGQKNLKTGQESLEQAQTQTRISQFGEARRLLWDDNLGARMTSIAALWRLAKDYPKQEHANVMDIFTGFLKNPPPYELDKKQEYERAGKRKDIDAILGHIKKGTIKGAEKVTIDLRDAHLIDANLRDAHLEYADLSLSIINGADFTDARGLTQEKIDECVFIIDSEEPKLPKLPEGINPTYKRINHREWIREKNKN